MDTFKSQPSNLEQIRKTIKSDPCLPMQVRSELCSAIVRFCEISGVEPCQVLADPTAIRSLRDKASWQIAELKAAKVIG